MIFDWLKKISKAISNNAGTVAGGLAVCAVAAGSTIITGGSALPAWLLALLKVITMSSAVGSASFAIQYFANASGNNSSQKELDELLNNRLANMLDADNGNAFSNFKKDYLRQASEFEQKHTKQKQDYEKIFSITERLIEEQTKVTRTLSETSISFSRLETETKTRFKAQEKVNTDLEDRLTDCEDEIDRLSANNDSEDGLEDNGFFAHPRRRNVVSANEVNFSQASTHRINN